MITITKQFEFAAAHKLPHHEGKCQNVHGHTYLLEITVGKRLKDLLLENADFKNWSSKGMVMDFSVLKKIVNEVIDLLDHKYLNDIIPNPTVELLILHIRGLIGNEIEHHARLVGIKLWESSSSYAEWKANGKYWA